MFLPDTGNTKGSKTGIKETENNLSYASPRQPRWIDILS